MDDPANWEHVDDLHVAVFNGGAWYSPGWLPCKKDMDEIDAAYAETLTGLLPYMKKMMEAGTIVIWYTLPYSLSDNPEFAHATFKSRNEVARRILAPEGVVVIDPFEMFKTRILHDSQVKCDELHFCGYGPLSPTVLEFQLILHYAAYSIGA
jgi:hypothetical protein